jgi:hypothetical protein
LVVGKVNVDEQKELVSKYGEPKEKFTGAESKENYIKVIEKLLD